MVKSLWQKAWPHVTVIVLFVLVAAIYCKPALEGKVLQQSDIVHWKGIAQQSIEYKDKYGHYPLWDQQHLQRYAGLPGNDAAHIGYFAELYQCRFGTGPAQAHQLFLPGLSLCFIYAAWP